MYISALFTNVTLQKLKNYLNFYMMAKFAKAEIRLK